jgi:hypothetical protein
MLDALPNMDTPFEYVAQAVALFDYTAMEMDELTLQSGQKLLILGIAQPSKCIYICL